MKFVSYVKQSRFRIYVNLKFWDFVLTDQCPNRLKMLYCFVARVKPGWYFRKRVTNLFQIFLCRRVIGKKPALPEKNLAGTWKTIWGRTAVNVFLLVKYPFLPASPKSKAGLGLQSLRPSVGLKILSSQLLWNYWSILSWNLVCR